MPARPPSTKWSVPGRSHLLVFRLGCLPEGKVPGVLLGILIAADPLAGAGPELAQVDPRAADVVTMRYFGGLTVEQIAHVLGVCPRTIGDDWSMARAWLRRELGKNF